MLLWLLWHYRTTIQRMQYLIFTMSHTRCLTIGRASSQCKLRCHWQKGFLLPHVATIDIHLCIINKTVCKIARYSGIKDYFTRLARHWVQVMMTMTKPPVCYKLISPGCMMSYSAAMDDQMYQINDHLKVRRRFLPDLRGWGFSNICCGILINIANSGRWQHHDPIDRHNLYS